MNDNSHSLKFFSLPGHSCRATKAGWAGRNVALKLRQGIVVNIIKVTVTGDQTNMYTSNLPNADHLVACIVLKGQLQIKFPNEKESTLEPQKYSLFPAQSLNFRVTAPKQEKLYLLTYSFPRKIISWSIKGSQANVSSCFNAEDTERCRYMGIPVNREIHRSVAEIMGSRLQGQLLKLYLEGAILQTLAHKIDQLDKLPPESDLLPPKSENDRLRDAREHLLSNLIKPPTIKQLATKFGMTERRFSKGFRELFGTSIHDTLLTKRMTMAMEMLEQGELPLNNISHSSGYKHVSNFISAFTRYYGLPPRAYMRQTRK